MTENIQKLAIGAVGTGLTEVAEHSLASITPDITSAGNLIIQIVIGICTLIGIFRKKPKN